MHLPSTRVFFVLPVVSYYFRMFRGGGGGPFPAYAHVYQVLSNFWRFLFHTYAVTDHFITWSFKSRKLSDLWIKKRTRNYLIPLLQSFEKRDVFILEVHLITTPFPAADLEFLFSLWIQEEKGYTRFLSFLFFFKSHFKVSISFFFSFFFHFDENNYHYVIKNMH